MCEKKVCKICGEEKEIEFMAKGYNIKKDGTKTSHIKSICKKCHNKQRDERRRKKGNAFTGDSPRVKRMRERNKEWSNNNPEDRKLIARRHTLRKYGLTLESYDYMLKEQNECCKICGAHYSQVTRQVLDVDHCHATGKVRGLLCTDCNGGLGKFRDNTEIMQKAIQYILEQNKFDNN